LKELVRIRFCTAVQFSLNGWIGPREMIALLGLKMGSLETFLYL